MFQKSGSSRFSRSRSPIKLNQILSISKARCGHNMLLSVRSNSLSDVQYAKNFSHLICSPHCINFILFYFFGIENEKNRIYDHLHRCQWSQLYNIWNCFYLSHFHKTDFYWVMPLFGCTLLLWTEKSPRVHLLQCWVWSCCGYYWLQTICSCLVAWHLYHGTYALVEIQWYNSNDQLNVYLPHNVCNIRICLCCFVTLQVVYSLCSLCFSSRLWHE
jgi:hypothetical protein